MSTRSYINPHPRLPEAVQRPHLTGEIYIENRAGTEIDALIRSLRRGDRLQLVELFLLAPAVGRVAARRKVFGARLDEVERRGCYFLETTTGADSRRSLPSMLVRAHAMISNSGRGRRGTKKGRPRKIDDLSDTQKMKIKEHWPPRKKVSTEEAHLRVLTAIAPVEVSRSWLYQNFGKE